MSMLGWIIIGVFSLFIIGLARRVNRVNKVIDEHVMVTAHYNQMMSTSFGQALDALKANDEALFNLISEVKQDGDPATPPVVDLHTEEAVESAEVQEIVVPEMPKEGVVDKVVTLGEILGKNSKIRKKDQKGT